MPALCARRACVRVRGRVFVFGRIGRPGSALEEITLQARWVQADQRKYPDAVYWLRVRWRP